MLDEKDYLISADVYFSIRRVFDRYQHRTDHFMRDIVEAIVFILITGCQWQHLPDKYPPRSTVHRWYQRFIEDGVFEETFGALIETLEETGNIKTKTAAIDATFIKSRGSSELSGKTKCGKGHKLMAIVDEESRPLALYISSAQPHEIKLVKETINCLNTNKNPEYLLGDGAYDSDSMDEELRKIDINLISPHKKTAKNPKHKISGSLDVTTSAGL